MPAKAVMNNQHVAGNLGATFARHFGKEAKIEALEPRNPGALLLAAIGGLCSVGMTQGSLPH